MSDPWWKGKALYPEQHERINAVNYPGTRQLCTVCDEPTGRCEDDSYFLGDLGALCTECFWERGGDDEETAREYAVAKEQR